MIPGDAQNKIPTFLSVIPLVLFAEQTISAAHFLLFLVSKQNRLVQKQKIV